VWKIKIEIDEFYLRTDFLLRNLDELPQAVSFVQKGTFLFRVDNITIVGSTSPGRLA
jgi:hypothetical protein